MSLKCKIFSLKKYLYFEISVYDRDKHCYFGKHSCYISKFFSEKQLVFYVGKDIHEESIYAKMSFI